MALPLTPQNQDILLWRGDRRPLMVTVDQVDPAWLDDNPSPTEDEVAAAPRVAVDLTGMTLKSQVRTEKLAVDGDESNLLLTLDSDILDAAAGKIIVYFQVPNDHPRSSYYDIELMVATDAPLTLMEGKLSCSGQRTTVAV